MYIWHVAWSGMVVLCGIVVVVFVVVCYLVVEPVGG